MPTPRIDIPMDRLAELCRKWKIVELSLFGSVLRDDFGPESDVDVLVVFDRDHGWSLFDFVRLQEELTNVFGRRVDLVERRSLRNPFIRHHALTHKQTIYAA